ncbi:septum site-determining protein Ssd [Allorhizocola rhizosphaerae]|uniref:septum site-determining protein Ssd n=1 Tax=Allorhizocola rhizosphaerae TaxID=1872709 RepID=UPI003CCC4A81
MTSDPEMLDDLLRIVAAVGAEADVAPDLAAARRIYGKAPLVLIGADIEAEDLRRAPPKRGGVVVVSRVHNDEAGWNLVYDVGAEHVIQLPTGELWLKERLTRALRAEPEGGKVVAVVGGRGGAGASVLAAALSVTAVREGRRTLLVDADPFGGGIDLLFGWEQEHGLRWPQLAEAGGRIDSDTLVGALPNRGDLVLLSCDRTDDGEGDRSPRLLPDVMQVVLSAGRAGRDLVVVDLPRHLDDAAECALRAADHALMVVTPGLRSTSAAARVAGAVMSHRDQLSIVLREPVSGRRRAAEVAKVLGLPLAGRVRTEPRLAAAMENGLPPGASPESNLAMLCARLLRESLS